MNKSLRVDMIDALNTDSPDMNGSYRFRNTPTRMSVGGYKE